MVNTPEFYKVKRPTNDILAIVCLFLLNIPKLSDENDFNSISQ